MTVQSDLMLFLSKLRRTASGSHPGLADTKTCAQKESSTEAGDPLSPSRKILLLHDGRRR